VPGTPLPEPVSEPEPVETPQEAPAFDPSEGEALMAAATAWDETYEAAHRNAEEHSAVIDWLYKHGNELLDSVRELEELKSLNLQQERSDPKEPVQEVVVSHSIDVDEGEALYNAYMEIDETEIRPKRLEEARHETAEWFFCHADEIFKVLHDRRTRDAP